MTQRFEAKWDTLTKVSTVIVLALITLVGIYLVLPDKLPAIPMNGTPEERVLALVFVLLVVLVTWLTSPVYYSIDNNNIIVQRRSGSLAIPISNIKEIRKIYKAELGTGIRLFGSGGLFGYLGIFFYRSIGRVNMNCTSRRNLILITTAKGNTMISPEEPEKFVETVKQHISKPS